MEIGAIIEKNNLKIEERLVNVIERMDHWLLALNEWKIDDQNGSNLFI